MSTYDTYHPCEALKNPNAYYERAFRNYPRPWLVPIVGNAALMLTRPDVRFSQLEYDCDTYFEQIPDDIPLIMAFSHRGKRQLHDPAAGIAAVYALDPMRDRIPGMRPWAAVTYMTDKKLGPIIVRHGGVSVIRSGDYAKFGLNPSEEDREMVTEALIDHTAEYLDRTGGTVPIFPAGTKGAEQMRAGVGMVMERLEDAVAVPVAIASANEDSGQIPKDLRLCFGEPIYCESGTKADEYVASLQSSMDVASSVARA